MRQRKVKNQEEKIAERSRYLIKNPREQKGHWKELFPGSEGLHLEVGCGKGKFITTLAEQNPEINYVAIEGSETVVLRALEKTEEKDLKNLFFVTEYVQTLSDIFERGEVEKLYLNFSDPWPKDRHAKRRLTHRKYLQTYQEILSSGSILEFKTDNDDLFAFSIAEFEAFGLKILELTRDLHSTEFSAAQIVTEYENRFRLLGKNINYCKVQF